jgi:hypothetical protein
MPGSSTNRRFNCQPPIQATRRFIVLGTLALAAILLQIALPASAQDQRGLAPENPSPPSYFNGRYYALVIGIDDYQPPMKKLKTAVNDAKAVGKLLSERYGFDVRYLLDQQATRFNILNAIGSYRNSLNPNDSLLIYYAGHGYSDHDADKAYWLPVDAESGISANRIIADDLTTDVKVLPSRHVLIVSDSCYSGGLARGSNEPDSAPNAVQDQSAYIARMMRLRSRTLLASGGDEPVADSGSNGHSVFAYALLQALSDVDKPTFSAIDLFYSSIRQQVAGRSEQVPEYSTIRNSSSEGGDFVFIRRALSVPPAPVQKPLPKRPAPEFKTAHIRVAKAPPGAEVVVDGRSMGRTDAQGNLSVQVNPGQHSLMVSKAGFTSFNDSDISVQAGETYGDSAPLRPLAEVQPSGIITADRTTIVQGQSVKLSWQANNASSLSINGTMVDSSGSMTVSPENTWTFQLRANNGTLLLGTVIITVLPRPAAPEQKPAPLAPRAGPNSTGITGGIHGHVTDPTGVARTSGTAELSTDGGYTAKYSFPVNGTGDFAGDGIAPGTYSLIYKQSDTPQGKYIDRIENVQIVSGGDTRQDIDMTRKEFLDLLTPQQRKQVEEFKSKNAATMNNNAVIRNLNADLAEARADNHAKKFADAEALMQRDTSLKPDSELLWYELGQAQMGLKKWSDASASMTRAIDLSTASRKPNPEFIGGAHEALGEIDARSNRPADAFREIEIALTVDPAKAGTYFSNLAVVFSSVGDVDAQVTAADKAITADPNNPLPYYLKGSALATRITVNSKTGALAAPPGCVEAYRKYLELAPNGPFAETAKAILRSL